MLECEQQYENVIFELSLRGWATVGLVIETGKHQLCMTIGFNLSDACDKQQGKHVILGVHELFLILVGTLPT